MGRRGPKNVLWEVGVRKVVGGMTLFRKVKKNSERKSLIKNWLR